MGHEFMARGDPMLSYKHRQDPAPADSLDRELRKSRELAGDAKTRRWKREKVPRPPDFQPRAPPVRTSLGPCVHKRMPSGAWRTLSGTQ